MFTQKLTHEAVRWTEIQGLMLIHVDLTEGSTKWRLIIIYRVHEKTRGRHVAYEKR